MTDTSINHRNTGVPLRELLADHDKRVGAALDAAATAGTGTGRVQALHVVDRVLTAHDSVVGSTLCPLLQDLPGGPEVAARLRRGCERRASLLGRFQSLSQGTEARNVYPVFGEEIEAILADLRASFDQHAEDETTRVSELLESTRSSVDPDVVAASMAIETGRAPARSHPLLYRHPNSAALRAFYRRIDQMHDWNDSHHGWPDADAKAPERVRPERRYFRRPPSIPDLLSDYDQTVEAAIAEVTAAGADGPRRAMAAYRLAAAISVHDSIVGGTLCRLLEAVPEGVPTAAVLHRGCHERSQLLEEWNDLTRHSTPAQVFADHQGRADRIIDDLITSFRAHETTESGDVSAVIEQLRQRTWKSGGTGLISPYLLPMWPNPEPGVLAAHMALWAEKVPTHSHPLLNRHPTNRLLRNYYRYVDRFRDWRQSRHGWPSLT